MIAQNTETEELFHRFWGAQVLFGGEGVRTNKTQGMALSKLLKGGSIRDYIGDYKRRYQEGY